MLEIENPSPREKRDIDSGDIPFGIRVRTFRETVKALHAKGYREDGANGDLLTMKVSLGATAGFPQIFLLDPDRP